MRVATPILPLQAGLATQPAYARGQLLTAAAWLAVLFIESEFLAVRNYEIRTHIRELLHFPLYHGLFASLACAIFLRYLWGDALARIPLQRLRPSYGILHLVCFGLIALTLRDLAGGLQHYSAAHQLLVWTCILVCYAGSWLAAVLPPSLWRSQLKAQGGWLAVSLFLGGLSMAIMHASNWLWQPLARGTFVISGEMLRLIYDDVVSDPQRLHLGTSTFHVSIEPGCSGYEGIGLVMFFGLVYLWIRRSELRFPQAILLLPIGMAFNWLLNTCRIAALIVIGTNFSRDLALKGFHSQAGWLAFTATSLLLVVVVEELGWFRRIQDAPVLAQDVEFPAAPYLLPLLTLLLASIAGQALTEGFDWSYRLRITACAIAIILCWKNLCRPMLHSGRPSAVLAGLIVYALWYALVHPGPGVSPWQQSAHPAWLWVWVAFRAGGSVVVIPIAEELAFRGYLLPRVEELLLSRLPAGWSWWSAAVITSALFGALHQDFLAATLAGLVYAYVYRKGSLGHAIVAHGITNFCIAAEVIYFQRWGLW